jgi:AcrR family transcriptional regulator
MAEISNAERYRRERQQQVQDRRASIIDAAECLFLDKGLANTAMIEIAQKAHISKVTLYRYFSSRDQIAFKVAIRMLEQIATTATQKIPKNVAGIEAVRMGFLNMIREFGALRDASDFRSAVLSI